MNKKYVVKGFTCYCDDNNVHIVDSYKVKEIDDFLSELKPLTDADFDYKRSLKDWSTEWYAHNLIYKFGLFRSHTKDVDLNENEYKLAVLIYKLMKPFALLFC